MTQYDKDQDKMFLMNSNLMSRAYYNLVVSIRDVKLWKSGMRPHRHWRITQVKTYFGVKGSTDKILDQLIEFREEWVSHTFKQS